MNCHYCQKECRHINISNNHWRCLPCKVDYRGVETNIFGMINSTSYYFNIYNGPREFPVRIMKGLPNDFAVNIVVNLTSRPDITPSNVEEKLRTYLLFS